MVNIITYVTALHVSCSVASSKQCQSRNPKRCECGGKWCCEIKWYPLKRNKKVFGERLKLWNSGRCSYLGFSQITALLKGGTFWFGYVFFLCRQQSANPFMWGLCSGTVSSNVRQQERWTRVAHELHYKPGFGPGKTQVFHQASGMAWMCKWEMCMFAYSAAWTGPWAGACM